MWHKEALLLELKKRAAYVYDFWLKMLIPPIIQIVVAYYLWDAMYTQNGTSEIGGYTFPAMMLYYVVAALMYQMVQPEVGIVLMDIYEGTLTKYLFYPLSFFQFKFIAHAAQMLLVGIQMALVLAIYMIFFNAPTGNFSPLSVLLGTVAVAVAGYLFFIFAAALEVIGFWVETVWGLVIMLQFVTNLLGGKLIPLSVFPEWAADIIYWSPFPYMVAFPTRAFLGEVGSTEFLMGIGIGLVWCGIFTGLAKLLWNRGSYQYSGTGM